MDILDMCLSEAELLARDVEDMVLADPVIPYERARNVLALIEDVRSELSEGQPA